MAEKAEWKPKPGPKAKDNTKAKSPESTPNIPTKSFLPPHLHAPRPPPPPPPEIPKSSTPAPSPASPSPSTKSQSTAAPSYRTRQTTAPSYRSRPSAPPSPVKQHVPALLPLPPKLVIPIPDPRSTTPPRLIPYPNQHKRCYSAPLPPGSLTWSSSSDEEHVGKAVTFKMIEESEGRGLKETDNGVKEGGETPGSAFVHWLVLFSRDYVIPPAFQKLMN